MTKDQDSLHDSLTETHQHAQASSYEHVEMAPPLASESADHRVETMSEQPALVSQTLQQDNNTNQSIFGDAAPFVFGTSSPPAPGNTATPDLGSSAEPVISSTSQPGEHGNIPQAVADSIAHSNTTSTNQPSHPFESGSSQPTTQWGAPSEASQPTPQWGASSEAVPITASETTDAFQQAEHGVEVGRDSEQDDGYETDGSAASMSLASGARNFIFENGRRYHSFRAGAYSFPNDDREQDREDLKHAMYLKLFNKALHLAPIPTSGSINVIDLGTGTGIWAIDFADQYPDASVLGIDLSPIQTNWVPPNLKFMVDDAESDWVNPTDHFDYIHTRHTIQAFHNWPRLFGRAYNHLKPGGWIECQEIDHFPRCEDGSMASDNPMVKYWDYVADGLTITGVDFHLAPSLAKFMRAAGFVNVTERVFFTPIGPWPKNRVMKEVGLYWRAVLMEGLEAIALGPFTRGLGWRKEEVEVFLASVRKAYLDKSTHSYMPFHVVYGQKPMY